MTEPPIRSFGDFELDIGRGLLRRTDTGETVQLTPRLYETLRALVDRPGDLITKHELLDAVWPGVSVEENSLARAVSALRKALGERPGEQRYIATVPGRGYRFVA